MNTLPQTLSNRASHFRPLLKSSEVMQRFGYTDRASFWDFVRREGVPHIRLNARRIMFEELALEDWIAARTNRA